MAQGRGFAKTFRKVNPSTALLSLVLGRRRRAATAADMLPTLCVVSVLQLVVGVRRLRSKRLLRQCLAPHTEQSMISSSLSGRVPVILGNLMGAGAAIRRVGFLFNPSDFPKPRALRFRSKCGTRPGCVGGTRPEAAGEWGLQGPGTKEPQHVNWTLSPSWRKNNSRCWIFRKLKRAVPRNTCLDRGI